MKSIGYGAYGDTSKITKAQKEKLIRYVAHTPKLSDRDFHKLAVKMGLLPDDAEEVIYEFVRKNFRNGGLAPSAPPPCPSCGKRHPHFIHTAPRGPRGAGRAISGKPESLYTIHMTPEELDSMIYGPMFEEMRKKRGIKCQAPRWEHPPTTPGHFLTNGHRLGENTDLKKTLPIWGLLGLLGLAGLFLSQPKV